MTAKPMENVSDSLKADGRKKIRAESSFQVDSVHVEYRLLLKLYPGSSNAGLSAKLKFWVVIRHSPDMELPGIQ